MRIIYFLFFSLLLFQNSFAQFPFQKQWDYRFGGTEYEGFTSFNQTSDGGFILGGYSTSNVSGDKSEFSRGQADYWIVKLDASGIKQWDKRFGGTDQDILSTVVQTADGGYLLAGYSASQNNGDKTQPSRGFYDYWIVKTDSLGNKIWDKRYGGDFDELLVSAYQTNDGGYILGGYSGSGINGDKTTINRGYNDYWLVKTDSIGTVLWDKDFGGTDYDFMYNMIVTDDGGFLLGGSSSSPAGPDKTQNIFGANDVWVIKTDSLGNKQWDVDFGGFDYDQLNSLCQSNDGGYLLACYSASGISGNKTQDNWNLGTGDVWLIKIDAAGNLQWDKDFGGTSIEDGLGSVLQNSDGGYFVISNSFSGISGNKTEDNLGISQAWVLKLDSTGNYLWDKTIFTDPEQKVFPMMIQTHEGCYAIAESTYGDSAGYKTQHNWDPLLNSADYWIIRYCDTTAVTTAAFVAPNNVCPGACIDFTNTSIYANSFVWNFPGSNTPYSTDMNPQSICYNLPGTYDVTLIASGSTGTDTLTLANYISVYPFPPPQGILQSGDTLFANQGAVSYQWYFNGTLIPGATEYYYVAPEGGNYNVVATDSNGCEVEAVIFDVVARIESIYKNGEGIIMFPNPVTDFLSVSKADGKQITNLSVFNLLGEKIITSSESGKIDCGNLSKGIYILVFTSEEKIVHMKFQRK